MFTKCRMESIEAILMQSRLRWTYVIRMPDHRLSKFLMYSQLLDGQHNFARPLLRYKVKSFCQVPNMIHTWAIMYHNEERRLRVFKTHKRQGMKEKQVGNRKCAA